MSFQQEYQRRLAANVCLTSIGGRFLCNNIVAPKIRAMGCCVCDDCDRREEERAANCDARHQYEMEGPHDDY